MKPPQYRPIFILLALIALIPPDGVAFGETVLVTSGGELTARSWPSGTKIELPKGAVLFVDRPVRFEGVLKITGNGAWLKNRQGAFESTFVTRDGQALFLSDVVLAQSPALTKSGWRENRGLTMRGGYAEFRGVYVADGLGVQIESSRGFTWVGGGTHPTQTTRSYSLYAGNNLTDSLAEGVYVQYCDFRVGRGESGVRLMNARAKFVRCRFTADTADGRKHRKESTQPRGGTIEYVDCDIGAISAGNLAPSIDKAKHADWARNHPTVVTVTGGSIAGYVEVSGNTRFVTEGVKVSPDPRKIGGGTALNLINHHWGNVTMRPTGVSKGTAVSGFNRFAADAWQVGPNCTLNGERVR